MNGKGTSQRALEVFGRNLVRLREQRDWSTEDVASKAGLAVEVVATYERGEASASLADQRRLAGAFGAALNELVGLD